MVLECVGSASSAEYGHCCQPEDGMQLATVTRAFQSEGIVTELSKYLLQILLFY